MYPSDKNSFTIRLPDDIHDKLIADCAANGRSKVAHIKKLIEMYGAGIPDTAAIMEELQDMRKDLAELTETVTRLTEQMEKGNG